MKKCYCIDEPKYSNQISYELLVDGVSVKDGSIGFRGNGIQNITQTTSDADGGVNIINITTDDGNYYTFSVKNGRKGNAGFTPTKGVDYWTSSDKEGIIQDVLRLLSNGDSMAF